MLRRVWPRILEVTTQPGMPADRRAHYLGRQTSLVPGYAGFSRVRNQFADPLWMLLGLTGLLFTIACASAANLLLARGVERQREIAVRLAIGASRGRLVRQFITESVVWTVLGAAAGLIFASWTGNLLVAMLRNRDNPIDLDLGPNWRITLFVLGLTFVTVAVCSILPALRATSLAPAPALRSTAGGPSSLFRRWSVGKTLVAAQVALTLVLLVGGALFLRSLSRVLNQPAGFDRHNLLVVSTDAEAVGYEGDRMVEFYRTLHGALASIPGVASASLSMYPPISNEDGAWTQSIAVDGTALTPENTRYVYFNAVSPGYFATVGTRLIQGRDFTAADDESSTKVVVVNESLARRFFQDANPIGRRVSIGRDAKRRDLEIVGIAGDSKYQHLQEPSRSIAYLPLAQQPGRDNLFVEVRSAVAASAIVEPLRRGVRAVDRSVPLRIEAMTERIRESLVRERVLAILAATLGCVALVLASAGLYGILAYAVSRRTKEIGLRLALGAGRTAMIASVMRDCLLLTLIGIAVGLAGSLALGRFARTLLYQISATDAGSIASAILLMLIVATAAGFIPARRAARVDPVTALKID